MQNQGDCGGLQMVQVNRPRSCIHQQRGCEKSPQLQIPWHARPFLVKAHLRCHQGSTAVAALSEETEGSWTSVEAAGKLETILA